MHGVSERLVERGFVSAADLSRAIDVQKRTNASIPATLVRLGLIGEEELANALAEELGLPLIASRALPDDLELSSSLNPRFLARHALVPIDHDGDLLAVMADPTDANAKLALEFALGKSASTVVATYSDIVSILTKLTPDPGHVDFAGDESTNGSLGDVERLLEEDSDAPVIRAVQRLLSEAAQRRASDVHIEPMARYVAVRYRIDGRLVEIERLSDRLAGPIARRIKVMSGLDIAEARLPQDGRLRVTVRGREIDVRVSTSPTAWGESIVLRILARSEVPLELTQLGLPEAALNKLFAALKRPHGIILLTGPTGSGKTTTLYAALNLLRRPEVKILTVEDPVEILIEGINQVQVRPEIDLSYAATLRAFLRQDPDILMIGEIRDRETADIAMRAALTGHLVLSTLHTNSASGAFTRLADIGIEPYLTASTVIATVAQRLIRSLCVHCSQAHPITDTEALTFSNAGLPSPEVIHHPIGCPHCQETGYSGRLPLIEILEVDERLRALVREEQVDQAEDLRPAEETLMGHGLALIGAGRTTFAEVQRAVNLI